MVNKTKKYGKFDELPRSVQHAALLGLGDPIDCGGPRTPEEVLSLYNKSRETAARLGLVANLPRKKVYTEKGEGSVFCGDCMDDVSYGRSCPHIRVGPRGGVTTFE